MAGLEPELKLKMNEREEERKQRSVEVIRDEPKRDVKVQGEERLTTCTFVRGSKFVCLLEWCVSVFWSPFLVFGRVTASTIYFLGVCL